MESIAWSYATKGDLNSAAALFSTLDKSLSHGRGNSKYGRLAKLCRVLDDPHHVPLPHRHVEIVAAILEPAMPPAAVFLGAATPEAVQKQFNRLIVLVHPDKNPEKLSSSAFAKLQQMRAEYLSDLDTLELSGPPLSTSRKVSKTETPPRKGINLDTPLVAQDLPKHSNWQQASPKEVKVACFNAGTLDDVLRPLRLNELKLKCDLSHAAFESSPQTPPVHRCSDTDIDNEVDIVETALRGQGEEDLASTVREALLSSSSHFSNVKPVSLQRPPSLHQWRRQNEKIVHVQVIRTINANNT